MTQKQRNKLEKALLIIEEIWENQAIKAQNMEDANMEHLPNFDIVSEEAMELEEVKDSLEMIICK